MTYQEKVYSREMTLNDFEVSVDIYLKSNFLTNEEIITLIKNKHAETSAKLEKIHSDYLNAPKPQEKVFNATEQFSVPIF
jgi:hypothetical protein